MATRILSIDGGGIRGVVAAFWLRQLERKLQKGLHESFDLFAGTSTGAIIAAALASGLDAEGLYRLYRDRGREIFAPGSIHRLLPRPMRGLVGPTYTGKGFEKVLADEFGEKRLSDVARLKKRLLIVAFDVYSRGPVLFDSDEDDYAGQYLSDLCRASAAAPTYFPAHRLTLEESSFPFLDGGLSANNPSAIALARARRASDEDQVLLVSVGTGRVEEAINTRKVARQVLGRGKLTWAKPVIDYLFDGSSETNHEVARDSVPDYYFRFQTGLEKNVAMDRASAADLDDLVAIARREWLRLEAAGTVARLTEALEADAFVGTWSSKFRWAPTISPQEEVDELKLGSSSEDEVAIRQLGNMISGKTVGEAEFEYGFHGKIVHGHDLIGSWRSQKTDLEGTFQLRQDSENPDVVRGVWSGTGTQGLWVGTWTLTRQRSGLSVMTTPRWHHSIRRSFSRDVEHPLEALDHVSWEELCRLDHGQRRYALRLARCAPSTEGLPKVLISAGVHGDETAGVYAAVEFLRELVPRYRDRLDLFVLPCVNPSGFEADTLETMARANLNRLFGSAEAPREIRTIQQWLERETPRFRMTFDLHETVPHYRGEGFVESNNPRSCYLYETRRGDGGRIGRMLIDSLPESVEVCQWPQIYLDDNDAGVIAYPEARHNPVYAKETTFDGYLFKNGYTEHSFTTETPTGWSLEQRIEVQLLWLEKALEHLLESEP